MNLPKSRASASLLRTALWANCVFSALCGIALLVATGAVADLLGVEFRLPLQVIGAGLLAFAADLAFQATRARPSAALATLTSASDFGWVAGTAIVLIGWGKHLSSAGVVVLIAVAAVVALFGTLQLRGVRRMRERDTVAA